MTPTLEPEIALQRLRAARQAMAARVAEIRAEIAGKGLLGRILARRRHAAALRCAVPIHTPLRRCAFERDPGAEG